MNEKIYIPEGAQSLENAIDAQFRLGIQGFPGTGKTWAATTFLNTVFLNLNRGLGAHIGRKDILEVKLYDPSVIDKWAKRTEASTPNQRDAVINWLEKEGMKLTAEQTLVCDNATELDGAFHREEALNPTITAQGKIDDRAPWKNKITYFSNLFAIFQYLKCNVIFLAHEIDYKEKDGTYKGKVRPILTGQAGDRMVGSFTDWFRAHSGTKPKPPFDKEKLANWKMTEKEFESMLNTFPGNTFYFWQCMGDDIFDAKASSLVNPPLYMPANYEHFNKWRRKA